MNEYLIKKLKEIVSRDSIFFNEPMSMHTSFKTGGNCDVMVIPRRQEEIVGVVRFCRENAMELTILGNCTNILVSDKGIRGICLKIAKGFDDIRCEGNVIIAKAGALLSVLSKTAYENSLTGLEFASGIPGTIGGGVSMNAGAYDGAISDVLKYSTYIDEKGDLRTIDKKAHNFSYRKSFFTNTGLIITECAFELTKGDKDKIREKMVELNKRRRQSQPLDLPSAGSVFKRPQGYFTGRLIEDCGLKGYCMNGAGVSEKHAGFIVNTNADSSSEDIKLLIDYIIDKVYNKFGVILEPEIKFIGDW